MQVIDALWETRNLGVSCCEISVNHTDSTSALEDVLYSLNAEYQVVKIPVARYDLIKVLNKANFNFIESSINVTHNLHNIYYDVIKKRMNDSIKSEKMTAHDTEHLNAELKSGIFITDRIYLDTTFTKDMAAQRYIYWIQDECNRGANLYKLVYKGNAVGFFIFKEIGNGGCYPFLSGLYTSFKLPGLGNILLHKIIEEARGRNLKYISSYISTNNIPVIKIHIAEGFSIANINYVYIKHNRNIGVLC